MVRFSGTERKERMDTSSLMEQILSNENLNEAYLQVIRNKGADGMKYTELNEHLITNGDEIKGQLRNRKYTPSQSEEWRYQSQMAAPETWEYQR